MIIVGKNNPKLRATELELGSFGSSIQISATHCSWTFFWQKLAFIPSGESVHQRTWRKLFLFCSRVKHLGSAVQFGTSMVGDGG